MPPLEPPPADTKDWTWVTRKACPDCGVDASRLTLGDVPGALLRHSSALVDRLARAEAERRPDPSTWSPLEYACHVRDVHRVMTGRLALILGGSGEQVPFADWDQDAAAVEDRYWEQDPTEVAAQLLRASEDAAAAWAVPTAAQAHWPGVRSNGSEFTIESLGRYHVHDVAHHAWDVRQR